MKDLYTEDMLAIMVEIANQVIRPRFRSLTKDQIDEKTPGDYVTVADRESEKLLTQQLLTYHPNALVVGEEAAFSDPDLVRGLATAELAYTVDPVDGTGNFVRGSSKYAVMVAEIRHSEVTRSWILHPESGQTYVAEKGKGVRRNGELLTPPDIHQPVRGGGTRKVWNRFDFANEPVKPVGSNFCAGFDYPQLLSGEADFFVYSTPKPWDHLPGLLMLQELSGTITQSSDEPYGPANYQAEIICASINPQLARQVNQHFVAS